MDRMRSVEIQARSAEEAIRLALEQLGCTRDQVEEDRQGIIRSIAKNAGVDPGEIALSLDALFQTR